MQVSNKIERNKNTKKYICMKKDFFFNFIFIFCVSMKHPVVCFASAKNIHPLVNLYFQSIDSLLATNLIPRTYHFFFWGTGSFGTRFRRA